MAIAGRKNMSDHKGDRAASQIVMEMEDKKNKRSSIQIIDNKIIDEQKVSF